MPELYRVIIAPEAVADLAAIHDYIAQNSAANANKMVQRILTAIEALRAFPHRTIFRRGPNMTNSVRTLPVGSYVIYFVPWTISKLFDCLRSAMVPA